MIDLSLTGRSSVMSELSFSPFLYVIGWRRLIDVSEASTISTISLAVSDLILSFVPLSLIEVLALEKEYLF